jgi:galactokinase
MEGVERERVEVRWRAPGRINLIGEHTDYNGGFALPIAIGLGCTATVTRLHEPVLRLRSAQEPEDVEIPLDAIAPGALPVWCGYAAGVLRALQRQDVELPGLDIRVDGDVPLGAGLSSSAALSCSVAAAVDDVLGLHRSRAGWVALARSAENDFVGAPTGGMDQLASVLGQERHALLCDLQGDADGPIATPVPFDPAGHGLALLVTDTRAPHRHADGEYRDRRAACEQAAALLGVPTLRAVQDRDHEAVLAELARAGADGVVGRRVRHVLTENDRVLRAVELLTAGDLAGVGPLFTASHASMRDDFEITVPEVDLAADTAMEAGAIGARMTGGGFGGCVIALVPQEQVAEAGVRIRKAFAEHDFREPTVGVAVPGPGVRRL